MGFFENWCSSMTDSNNVQVNKPSGKRQLSEMLQSTDYQELKDKLKFDILSDPRLHSLKELFELYESLDGRLGKIEKLLTENLVKEESK